MEDIFFDMPRDRRHALDVNRFGLNTFENPPSNRASVQFERDSKKIIESLKFPKFTNPFQTFRFKNFPN